MDEVASDVHEGENSHDSHEDTYCSVGHLHQEISQEHFFLLIVGRPIKAKIAAPQKRSDLPQDGLKVLCELILEHHRYR